MPIYPSLSLGENYPTFKNVVIKNKISKEAKALMYVYYFLKWIKPITIFENDFDNPSSNREVYKNYLRLIKCFYDYLQSESNETLKRINVFTINYDLLFERVFDDFLFDHPLIYFNYDSRGFF
ncbi:hypothetical protein MCAV_00440 [[Mycoplasma] cavipharyngis]|uniref:hypothetical protein n=1 Tax=[Mycoplasma] cavipharyngis TaxID=92757 RepID=UPI0037046FE5